MSDGLRQGLAIAALASTVLVACSNDGPRRAAPAITTSPSTSSSSTSTSTTTTMLPVAVTPSCPPAPARATPWATRPKYDLRLDIKPAEGLVGGSQSVRFTPDRDTDRLVFRLWPNAPRTAAGGANIDVGQITIDGRPAAATLDTATVLSVPVALRAGQSVTAQLPWQLRLPGAVNDRLARVGDALRLGSFFPILPWEPGVGWALDPPTTGFAEASTAPVADFTMRVAVPPGFDVLASGVPDGAGTWTATAMRDVALSVGHFAIARGVARGPDPVEVTVGVDASVALAPQPYLDKAVRAIQSYASRFGSYPFPTYTLAVTPALSGGIEYPSHVMQGPATIGRTTSHEIGHQWFYGLVGNDQGRDPWLDEALATWAEWGYEGTLAANRARAIPLGGRGQVGAPMSYWDARESIYSLSVYIQGAQALASLGSPDLVDCALRIYAAVNAYRIARPADLIRAAQAVFPNAEPALAAFGIRP